jgi:hypothetical protein
MYFVAVLRRNRIQIGSERKAGPAGLMLCGLRQLTAASPLRVHVTLSQPIGAIMLVETGGEGARFLPRVIEGVKLSEPKTPDRLILGGQQRLTSLYRALRSHSPVDTYSAKGEKITRVYYLDVTKCLDPAGDRYDAILSLPVERQVTSDFGRKVELDLTTREQEWQLGMLPADLVFDPPGWQTWTMGYQKFHV